MAESSGARVLLVELVVLPGSVELVVFMSVKLLSVELVLLLLGWVSSIICSIGGIGIGGIISCIGVIIGIISIIDNICCISRIDC